MENAAVIRSFSALMGQDPDVAEAFLIAAVYCRALQVDSSPREVVETLFKAMPSAEGWPALSCALVSILEDESPGKRPADSDP